MLIAYVSEHIFIELDTSDRLGNFCHGAVDVVLNSIAKILTSKDVCPSVTPLPKLK